MIIEKKISIEDIALTYSTEKEEFLSLINEIDKENLKRLLIESIDLNLSDPNFSSLAEKIPMSIAGYNSHNKKHGYDGFIGEDYETAVEWVEHKPKKVSSKTNSKLNGSGGFADYTLTRLENDLSKKDKLTLMISGFVDSNLVYAFKVPHNYKPFMDHIKNKTILGENKKRILPTFSYKNYEGCEDIKMVYMVDNIDDYISNISGPFLKFLKDIK